jgi:hypothetical protein
LNTYTFRLGASTAISVFDDPIRVTLQGLRFSKNKFIENTNTPTIKIPQIFTFESWIRFDTENPGQFGDLQYIYQAVRDTQYFAIALDNNYMKVIINDAEGTYFNNWISNTGWRYLAVTVIKNYVDASATKEISSSQVKIYIDRTLATTLTIPSYFKDI